jgi:hypothetical protein
LGSYKTTIGTTGTTKAEEEKIVFLLLLVYSKKAVKGR